MHREKTKTKFETKSITFLVKANMIDIDSNMSRKSLVKADVIL